MQEADMDVASEFIEMAARLIYIKTVSLLPVYEEAKKLKEELTGELLEYRDCKLMAQKQIGRQYRQNYIESLSPKEYAQLYSDLKLPDKISKQKQN